MGRGYQNKSSTDKRRKAYRAAGLVRKATTLLRARSAGIAGTPLSTRGFTGPYGSIGRRPIPEMKFTDITATSQPISNNWTIVLINGVAQGQDYNQRIGRQARMRSSLLNGIVYNQTSTSNPQGTGIRICLIWDYQPNSGTTPVGTDIFVSQSLIAPMNLNNRDRFKVLLDRRIQIGAFTITTGNITAGAPQNVFISKYRKMYMETIFSGVGATLGSIATGALYLCYIADVTSVTSWDYYTRVRYQDM